MGSTGIHTHGTGWRYGLLGLPLAFVSLPLYVTLPRHYAEQYAVPLGTLGVLLLLTRLLDAVLDPRIGHWVDQLFARHARLSWRAAAVASVLMAAGFAALWMPPPSVANSQTQLLAWLAGALVLTYLAYSLASMVHQAWGARWGGQPEQRARLVAWREGTALAGVLLASLLPAWLGLQATSVVQAVALGLGLWTLHQTLHGHSLREEAPSSNPRSAQLAQTALTSDATTSTTPTDEATAASGQANTAHVTSAVDTSPWRTPAFVALLIVFLLNGTASAIPATLLPFFVRDTLQAPNWEPLFLGSYFLAAAIGLPLWVRLVKRIGLAPAWLLGMALSVLAFCAVPWLGSGDTLAFEAICVLTGLALGADLAIPGALLTGVIHHAGLGRHSEGRFFGWWTAATKLNLALASGLALPLLAVIGYETGRHTPDNQFAMAISYGLLPCVFKLLAAAALWQAMRRHPILRGQA